MKKTKVYLPLFVIVVTALGLTFDVVIPNVYSLSYDELVSDKKNNMWQLGKNLEVGDSFTYKICDPGAILNYSAESYHYFTKNLEHNSSLCYTVTMYFANLITSDENDINSDIWIVQASIVDYTTGEFRNSIFHIDADSWNVRSADTIHPDTIRYAESIQDTLFSIHKYTASEPKLLQKGIKWGEVTEYHDLMQNNPYMTVLDSDVTFNVTEFVRISILSIDNIATPQKRTLDVSSVGYEIKIIDASDVVAANDDKKHGNNVTNFYLISSDLPFPVKATYYSPSHIVEPFKEYEFELISYFDASIVEDKTPDKDITTDDKDIHFESGTIELTFPDDTITSEINSDDIIDSIIPDEIIPADIIDSIIPGDQGNLESDETFDTVKNQDNTETVTTKDNAKPDSSLAVTSLIILVVVIVAVIIYLKFRGNNSSNSELFGKNKKKSDNTKQHQTTKTIPFDDSITIDIQSKENQVIS